MTPYLICNPGSRGGRGRTRIDSYRALLTGRGVVYEIGETACLDDAFTLSKRAADTGFDPIVAVGGDGTINRVLNGILASQKRPAMGVLYAGTSPDFCRFHTIPTDTEAAVDCLVADNSVPIDVGCITTLAGEVRHFGCSMNVGLGHDVASRSNRLRPYLGDFAGTLLATIASIVTTYRADHIVEIDGERVTFERALNLTIGKNPHLASGLKIQTEVTADDGKLYLFAIHETGPLGLLLRLPLFYSGKTNGSSAFTLRTAKSVSFITPPHQLEYDGDPHDLSPMTIEVVPKALKLIRRKNIAK